MRNEAINLVRTLLESSATRLIEKIKKIKLLEKKLTLDELLDSPEDFELIKNLERTKFPEFMHSYQEYSIEDKEKILAYFDVEDSGDVVIHIDDNNQWYLIMTIDSASKMIEVPDMAGNFGPNLLSELKKIFRPYNDYTFEASLRETTSYRIFKSLAKYNYIEILYDNKRRWQSEMMHDVGFKCTEKMK